MSSMGLTELPLPGNVPQIVSYDPSLLTAWDAINAWSQKVFDTKQDKKTLIANACFILMTCKFLNLRVQQISKERPAERMFAGLVVKKMQGVSSELGSIQAVADWLGQESSLQASVKVGRMLYNTLYQQRSQYRETAPIPKGQLLPVQRVWNVIALVIETSPEPQVVRSIEVKSKLAWLEQQSGDSSKRSLTQDNEGEQKSKKAKTAEGEIMKMIEVIHPDDMEIIKRYDNEIGVVPIEGPVRNVKIQPCFIPHTNLVVVPTGGWEEAGNLISTRNRSVVTAHDVSSLSSGHWVNDVAIDAHLTLLCHTFNGLFQTGVGLPKSPKYHAWSVQMSSYLGSREGRFQEKHLRQEWPPARFPNAAMEEVACHIFPIHVRGNHLVLMVLQRTHDGQWALWRYSSLPGYDDDFAEPWQIISAWFFFKSKGAFDMRQIPVHMPSPQPTQDNSKDCGVFVCGIVRWTLAGWDLSTLTPSIILEYRRRMMLELERWSLSINSL